MNSIQEHNQALQNVRYFTTADLEANKQGRYSPEQIKRDEDRRAGVRESTPKYQNKGWVISIVMGIGLCFFTVVLYFVGVFETLQSALGGLFLPVMAGAGFLALLFVFVIAPRSYQSSVDMYKGMGASLEEKPLGQIQVIEARADVYESRGGITRRGHQSTRVAYILQMDSIKFNVTDTLMNTIEKKRLYRVYCVNNDGYWQLLSMETIE